MQSGLLQAHPMVALAKLVSLGAAHRPPLQAYLQHPAWKQIWIHILETAGLQPGDEFAALQHMRPLEEEFMRQAEASGSSESGSSEQEDESEYGPALKAMMDEYGIAEEVVQRKYVSYALTLRLSGRNSDWNEDVDEHARAIGALSEQEIAAARHDFHQAVLNRIKIALVSEGWLPVDPDDPVEGTPDSDGDLFDGNDFPTEIQVPGGSPDITIPAVSFASVATEEELRKLYLTACAGAANLLVPEILERTNGAVGLPTARACALDLVVTAHNAGMAPSHDTRGLYVAGRSLLRTRWQEWKSAGNPTELLVQEYENLVE